MQARNLHIACMGSPRPCSALSAQFCILDCRIKNPSEESHAQTIQLSKVSVSIPEKVVLSICLIRKSHLFPQLPFSASFISARILSSFNEVIITPAQKQNDKG
jgi:hypothetical protein